MITKELWDIHCPPLNPFLRYEFIEALSKSGSIGPGTGWEENFLKTEDGILINFSKTHSYGEFIFDWAWAEAYERYGEVYYPKLTSMIPFTPVTTNHFLMKEFDESKAQKMLKTHDEEFKDNSYSSAHFLFLPEEEQKVFLEEGYLLRESMQYHFFNEGYQTFEEFLLRLKAKKAKTIRLEREFPELTIKRYTGPELTSHHAKTMYEFYIATIANKNSFDYLTEEFFKLIFLKLKHNILYVEASSRDIPIAGSLFFFDEKKLYGRYWGSKVFRHNLHFELCYYQGIEFCIQKKLEVFEAGAQGEHKIARGFRPVKIFSAHKMKNHAFHQAIKEFISQEKAKIAFYVEELSTRLPFK